jgi:uncharacterized membrane protein
MKSFSINEALAAGWAAFNARVGFFISLLLLTGVLTIIPQWIIKSLGGGALAIILVIAFKLFEYFLTVGMLRISLNIVDGNPVSINDLFSGGPQYVPYVLSSILYTLIVSVGLVLLVVPGIIAMIMLVYYGFFIVDRGLGPVEALKASADLTHGIRLKLFGFGLILLILNMLGFLLVGLGLFVTIPVTMIAMVFVYRHLLPQTSFTR